MRRWISADAGGVREMWSGDGLALSQSTGGRPRRRITQLEALLISREMYAAMDCSSSATVPSGRSSSMSTP